MEKTQTKVRKREENIITYWKPLEDINEEMKLIDSPIQFEFAETPHFLFELEGGWGPIDCTKRIKKELASRGFDGLSEMVAYVTPKDNYSKLHVEGIPIKRIH